MKTACPLIAIVLAAFLWAQKLRRWVDEIHGKQPLAEQ